MRVSWKWLKELVELELEPSGLAELMTMSGIEVDGIEYLDKGVRGVKTALIKEVKPHPNADKLVVCIVKTAENQDWTVVSGAPNLRPGLKVPAALPGAVLPGNKKIEETEFRGVKSQGMLCSAEELGLDADKLQAEQKEGIYILSEEVPLGEDIVKVLGLDDCVLELGLTPNRSDCLGMLNVAREVAALTGGKLNLPRIDISQEGGPCSALTAVEIAEPQLCKRYVARIIENVRIGQSPMWLRHRLLAAGIRPINTIVDVTNYVMMEMGQPLHAFDYDTLVENRIVVRRGQEGEELVTLDGAARPLNPEMLVIADAARAVGLAGVMGGLNSEVTEQTRTILLEAAHFNPINIRRTAQALGMRSEASLRFEKNVDLEQVSLAADRAVQLMAQLGTGIPVAGRVDCYPVQEEKYPILLRLPRINQILGTDLESGEVERILSALQIKILHGEKVLWHVSPPSYRRDLEKEIDIIEEIARLHGYNKIPTTLPYGATTQGMRTREQRLKQKIYGLLAAQGLVEVVNYSFINPRNLDWLQLPAEHPLRRTVAVKNPLSEEQGIMRTTVLPGLLETVQKNINKRNKNMKLFEIGKVYLPGAFPEGSPLPEEKWILGAAVTGRREKSWARAEEEYNFYYLKGIIENLFAAMGIKDWSLTQVQDIPWFHPGRTVQVLVRGQTAGELGEVHPLVREKYGIEQRVFAFTLDMESITAQAEEKIVYKPQAKYPAVTRDLAVVVPEQAEARDIARVISLQGKDWLKEIRLFDLYRGQQIKEGYKSLAYSLTWQAEDRTLTDEEVNALHRDIEGALNRELGADLRR